MRNCTAAWYGLRRKRSILIEAQRMCEELYIRAGKDSTIIQLKDRKIT